VSRSFDVARGEWTGEPVTLADRVGYDPTFPDGTRIVFASTRSNKVNRYDYNLYVASSNGVGEQKLLLETPSFKIPQDWSRDGRFLVYFELEDPKTGRDLWVLADRLA
jgi:Tol biopolymer transport system component